MCRSDNVCILPQFIFLKRIQHHVVYEIAYIKTVIDLAEIRLFRGKESAVKLKSSLIRKTPTNIHHMLSVTP